MPYQPQDPRESAKQWRMYAIASEWFFAGLAMGFIGYWIDRSLSTLPAFTLTLGTLGAVSGFVHLVREAMRSLKPPPNHPDTPKPDQPRQNS